MIKGNQKDKWEELTKYLKLWEQGEGADSQWKKQLDIFSKKIEYFFLLGSENITDGKPFFNQEPLKKIVKED